MTTAKPTPQPILLLRHRLLRGLGWLTAAVCAFLLAIFLLASLFVHNQIQSQFRELGITDVSWSVTALSHQHVRLSDIQFRYDLNDTILDANSTLAVHIQSLRLNFHWQGATWRSLPVLEQLIMSDVDVTLDQVPHQILEQRSPRATTGSDPAETNEQSLLEALESWQQTLSLEQVAQELNTFHWLANQWQFNLESLNLVFPCSDINDETCAFHARVNVHYHLAQKASLDISLSPSSSAKPQTQLRLAMGLEHHGLTMDVNWHQPQLFNVPFTFVLRPESIEFAAQLELKLDDWFADVDISPSRQPMLQVLEAWHVAAFSPAAVQSLQDQISDEQERLIQQLHTQLPLQPLQTAILASDLSAQLSGRLPWPARASAQEAQLQVDSHLQVPLGDNSQLHSTLALTHKSARLNLALEVEPEVFHALQDALRQQFPEHADVLQSLTADTPLQLQVLSTSELDLVAVIQALLTENSAVSTESQFTNTTIDVQVELNDFSFQHQDVGSSHVAGKTHFRLPLARLLQSESTLAIDLPAPTEFNLDLERWAIDDETQLQQVQLNSEISQFQFNRTAPLKSQISAEVALQIGEITHPSLLPQAWSGNLTIKAQPEHTGTHRLDASLENQAGLLTRLTTMLALETILREPAATIEFDWQLEDIFLIAGNPLAHTLVDWPALLTLERGRIQAHGQLALGNSDVEPFRLEAVFRLGDLVGIYDVSAFRGLNAEFNATMNTEQLVVSTEQLRLLSLQQGFLIGPIEAGFRYQAQLTEPLAGQLQLHHNQVQLFDGRVNLRNQVYDLSAEHLLLPVEFDALNLTSLLTQYPVSDFTGSGLLSGVIPIRLSTSGVFVDNGNIQALPPGGQLRYSSAALAGYAGSNVSMRTLMSVLENFHYDLLSGAVNYYDDGTLELRLSLQGQNPELENGRPVRLNLVLQENLPALLTSLQLTNQVNKVIEERLQQRLLRQR